MRMIEVPRRIAPEDDSGYLEELTKAIFRSGFSWRVVRQKWPYFQKAFDGFDVEKVAGYGVEEVNRLFEDPGIVRNRRKILGTVENAGIVLGLAQKHGTFGDYLRSLDGLDYRERVKELTGRFRGLGRTGAFVFLYCVDEPTPDWHDR